MNGILNKVKMKKNEATWMIANTIRHLQLKVLKSLIISQLTVVVQFLKLHCYFPMNSHL